MVKQSIQRLGFFFRRLTNRKLDVLDQLEEDHIRVELLFMQWRLSRTESRRRFLFDQIRHALLVHSQIEEHIFYPACAKIHDLKNTISDGIEDHHHIKNLLNEISELSLISDKGNSKMKTLVGEVESHVSEEENTLFPQVRKLMKKGEFNKLGREVRQFKLNKEHKTAA